MEQIGKFLDGILKSKKIDKQVYSAKVVDCFKGIATEEFGEDVLALLHIVSFKDGLLKLSAANSVIAYEVQIKKISLMERMNAVSEEEIRDVFCCVGGEL